MKGKLLLLAVSLLLLLASATSAQSQPNQPTKISWHFACQGFNPVHPAAMGHPVITNYATLKNTMSQFTVTNYSAKAVTSVEYGWRIAAPTGCTDSKMSVRWETAKADVNLAAGAEVTINTPEALSKEGSADDLVAQARVTNTPVVLVTIGIVKVTFADGTTWTDKEAVEHNTFDSNYYEKNEPCDARVSEF